VIYRDFAPFDSIIQTAGRCNRNNRPGLGEVYIVTLIDSTNKKKYYNYIYKPAAISLTYNLLKNLKTIRENELMTAIRLYYDKIKNISSSDISISIIEDIRDLNYAKVADNFNLIKNIPNVLVFVEKDETAGGILEHFKEILNIKDKWKRKDEFLKIKKSFYEYVLSVNLSKDKIDAIKDFEDIGNFKIITKVMLSTFYNNSTGFTYDYDNFI